MSEQIRVETQEFDCPLLEDIAHVSIRYLDKVSMDGKNTKTRIPIGLECEQYLVCGICTHKGNVSKPDFKGKCEHPYYADPRVDAS